MKIRELFTKDPSQRKLLNEGVAALGAEDPRTVQYELETFVCDGEYSKGLQMVLDSYLGNLGKPEQPAVWVSGFYGSGKSHLVKMLRYLWTDAPLDNGKKARAAAELPDAIRDSLKELTIRGNQHGGLHAAAGTLGSGSSTALPLSVLGIVFRSLGLPDQYAAARVVMWLKSEGKWDRVQAALEAKKRDVQKELRNLYVSTSLAEAILQVHPTLAPNPAGVLQLLKAQYPTPSEIEIGTMVTVMRDALTLSGRMPCTVVILDEVQQYISDDSSRAKAVQDVTEALSKQFDGQVMVVATGQAALSATPSLVKLKGRFTRNIHLSDTDVETVIRMVVLQKRPDREPGLRRVLDDLQGEISRHLVGTKIGPRHEDQKVLTADYPLLPVRQRFWERVLRANDADVASGQLRTQLRIADEAVRTRADAPVGYVVPADFIFDQVASNMVERAILPRELHNRILTLRSEGQVLGARVCALIFLISKMPREGPGDVGVRANAEMLADLLVEDLAAGSAELRKQVPEVLTKLAAEGLLLQVGNEYQLQTQESAQWEQEFRRRLAKALADDAKLAIDRTDLIRADIGERLKAVRLTQGVSKTPRRIDIHFGNQAPPANGNVPVWVRNGWDDEEKNVVSEARQAGIDSPLVTVFLPQRQADELKKELATKRAADETLAARGNPTTPEGTQARMAMESRKRLAEESVKSMFGSQVVNVARVILAGGTDYPGIVIDTMVQDAAQAALTRLYPQFGDADHARWDDVIKRAKGGAPNALEAVGHKGDVDQHAVCKAVLDFVAPGRKGSEIQKHFEASPFGWPREAVNAALMVLVGAGHVRGMQSGKPVAVGELDQTKIGTVDFRAESATVSAKQKIALRTLYKVVDVSCPAGQEMPKAAEFLARMRELASAAGGEPPLPSPPSTTHVKDLEALQGNELLLAIHDAKDRLESDAKAWKAIAAVAEQRAARWLVLERLVGHGRHLPAAAEVVPQADAVRTDRGLLAEPDPVPSLCSQLADAVRGELQSVHAASRKAHADGAARLGASDSWKRITSQQRDMLSAEFQLGEPPAIQVATEEDLLRSLDQRNLEGWQSYRDALPSRFDKAVERAARLLEPKASRVVLPAGTLKSEEDLRRWLDDARGRIAEKLKDGPVIV